MENRKLVRLGEGSAAVDLSRTAFRIVQAGREDDEMQEGRRGGETEDSGDMMAGENPFKLDRRETGDGEEETMDGEREDCEEAGVAKPIGESDHLEGEVGEDGERALSEEDEMDDMFRSSNLIIIPFPRERNRSSQISDPGVNDGAVEEEREEVEVEEVQSENDIEIEEELGKSESKDTAEENSDKSDQVQIRTCFPNHHLHRLFFSGQRPLSTACGCWTTTENLAAIYQPLPTFQTESSRPQVKSILVNSPGRMTSHCLTRLPPDCLKKCQS